MCSQSIPNGFGRPLFGAISRAGSSDPSTQRMSFFDNVRVELSMRSLYTQSVSVMIDQLEAEYSSETTTAERREDIFRQVQDAVTVAHATTVAAGMIPAPVALHANAVYPSGVQPSQPSQPESQAASLPQAHEANRAT